MSKNVDVSVIVPVYNTAEYLEECLDSILSQRLNTIEVLCVDDGSTDGSLEILEGYAHRDRRMHLLMQAEGNQGPGAARNLAIDQAKGDYVAFVDSDDYIHRDFLSSLHGPASKFALDVAMCSISKFSASGSKERYAACTYEQHIPSLTEGSPFTWRDLEDPFHLRFVAWNKLYNRAFLERHHIRFSEGIFFEDMIFTFSSLLQAERMWFVRKKLYHNRRQRQGATTYEQGDRVFGALTAMDQLEKFLASDPAYRDLDLRFEAFRFSKMTEYLYKNDAEHMPRFYASLQEVSRSPSLDENPLLSQHQVVQRDAIRENDLLGYLAWELWDTKTRYAKLRRRAARLQAQNRRLRSERERSVLLRFEMRLRRLYRAIRTIIRGLRP